MFLIRKPVHHSLKLQAAAAAQAAAARERESELKHELDKLRTAARNTALKAEGLTAETLHTETQQVCDTDTTSTYYLYHQCMLLYTSKYLYPVASHLYTSSWQ